MTDQADSPAPGPNAVEPAAPATLADLAAEVQREVATLDRELTEIEMLVVQARSEATRHETKRKQVADKLAAIESAQNPSTGEIVELAGQLVTLTKRAAIMDSQVEVLAGKQKVVARFRESLARYAASLGASIDAGAGDGFVIGGAGAGADAEGGAGPGSSLVPGSGLQGSGLGAAHLPPALSRVALGAQEDLRREIARSLHDGPAQSLTNIVLQAQIVERLMSRDPEAALSEVRQLMSMVQSTLEATKSFIFEVRPMVLDDLGLVPTLRRAARDRGRRAHVPVDFDSLGADRRLPMEVESGLFRILDEALGAYLGLRPERVSIRLDWSDHLDAVVSAARDGDGGSLEFESEPDHGRGKGKGKGAPRELPPALAAMIEDRRAAQAARALAALVMPVGIWREIQQRAATIGVRVSLGADGAELRVLADLPAEEE